ncbi:MAG: hypothetical protein K2L94_04450 [Alphaproteobacteria bacterium]|nr:hypothetical protein [Alphaproteobacteria bacterium]
MKLSELIAQNTHMKFATDAGVRMHALLRMVTLDDAGGDRGDAELVARIRANKNLIPFFGPNSRGEVPIAGIYRGKFISRRIDRMVVDPDARTVWVLDYKTDVDRVARREKYAAQLREYMALLSEFYPDFTVRGFILWIHDWTLESM